MVAGRPYYQAYPADFFTATQGWDLDMKGPYRLIIDLLNERDRPIPDDPKFVAGVLGCSVQRWRKVRQYLLDHGKLVSSPDGLHLTNPRFERERAERAEKLTAAQQAGRAGGLKSAALRASQQEMDFDPDDPPPEPDSRARTPARHARTEKHKNGEKIEKLSQNFSKSSSSHSQLPKEKPHEFNGSIQPPPQAPYARDSSETKEEDSTQPNSSTAPYARAREGGRLDDADLMTLYEAVCDAAGVAFVQPGAIDRAMTQVEKWRDAGIDFEEVVVPAITQTVLSSDDPTRTLARFNAKVLHEHARRKAAAKKGETYRPPQVPKLNPDGEDPSFLPLRTDLLEVLGPDTYSLTLNPIRLEDVGQCHGDRRPIRLVGPDHAIRSVKDAGELQQTFKRIALKHGFTDLW